MRGYILISADPGGTADPAAIVAMNVYRADRLTYARVLHMAVKPPVMTPVMHVDLVQQVTEIMSGRYGRSTIRYVVDISSNSAIAYLLSTALPRNSLIGVRISGTEQHGASVTPFLVGDVHGKASSIPVLTLSRRQMLLDIGQGFSTKQVTLPLDDPDQEKGVAELKRQMSRASLKVTPAGKSIAVVNRGHDDLLMALAQGWAATRLPPPRDHSKAGRTPALVPSSLGWT